MEAKPKPNGYYECNKWQSIERLRAISQKKNSDDVHAMNNWSRLNGIRIRSNDGDCEVDNVSGPYLAYIDPSNRKGCSKRSSILALVLIA